MGAGVRGLIILVRRYSRGQLTSDTLATNVTLLWHVVMRYRDAEAAAIKDCRAVLAKRVTSIGMWLTK
jgi:hypothetical protein